MKGIRVRCSDGKIYDSIRDAAEAAGVNEWTMSYKMVSAGGYIDEQGNEYTRVDPANFKNEYPNTGKTKRCEGSHTKRTPVETSDLDLPNTQGEFHFAEPVKNVEEPLSFDINGGDDCFMLTIHGLTAERLAKVIVLLTKRG